MGAYRLSPRLADVGGTCFWRTNPKADYGLLNDISANQLSLQRVASHWGDMLRVAGSLKLGKVSAAGIMRTLQIGNKRTRLAQAIAEFGRIDKTLHTLAYIDDETKRRDTLIQLNRGEGRHSVARAVFHGKRGELRQQYQRRPGGPARCAWPGTQHDRSVEHPFPKYLELGPACTERTGMTNRMPLAEATSPLPHRSVSARVLRAAIRCNSYPSFHSFHATGITEYRRNSGKLEVAQL